MYDTSIKKIEVKKIRLTQNEKNHYPMNNKDHYMITHKAGLQAAFDCLYQHLTLLEVSNERHVFVE